MLYYERPNTPIVDGKKENRAGGDLISLSLIMILRYGQVPLYGPFTIQNKRVPRKPSQWEC